MIDEPFDRAWRRVGVALDRGGFEVTDRDRSQGLFMINYLDPDYEQQKKSEQGFFANLFSSAKAVGSGSLSHPSESGRRKDARDSDGRRRPFRYDRCRTAHPYADRRTDALIETSVQCTFSECA